MQYAAEDLHGTFGRQRSREGDSRKLPVKQTLFVAEDVPRSS